MGVMDQYKVEIRFPDEGADPDIISVIGAEANVQECVDYILNLAEEYMQDIDDDSSTQQYLRSSKQEGSHGKRAGPGQTGFVVAGAPWEQQQHQNKQQAPQQQQQRAPVVAPNTLSNEEFPSFGGA